jgi:Protein of unknown function (DUF3887)
MNSRRLGLARSFSLLLSLSALAFLLTLQWGCSRKDVAKQTGPGPGVAPGTNNPNAGKTVQEDNPRGLNKDAKAVVENLCAGKNDPVVSEFNDKLKQAMPADKLKAGWDAYGKLLGPCKSQGAPSSSKSPEGLDTITIRTQMDHGIIDIDLVYDGAGKISGLWIRPQKT